MSVVRAIASGAVIVNDLTRRQLIWFDSQLTVHRVIADSTASTGRSYGGATDGLLTYRGDSSLFVDPPSGSMVVLDGRGNVIRVMAAPPGAWYLTGGPFGTPGFDAKGRLIYRGFPAPAARPVPQPGGLQLRFSSSSDSAPLIRLDLKTRQRDTVAFVKVPVEQVSASTDAKGRMGPPKITVNPLPVVDAWALLPTGDVVIMRGADYHMERVSAERKTTVFRKIPHSWQRLDDAAKQQVVDSAQVEEEKVREAIRRAAEATPGVIPPNNPDTPNRPAGVLITTLQGQNAGRNPEFIPSIIQMIPAQQLPDYRPAFRLGAIRVDTDGNVWVRTTLPEKPGAIYDVVDSRTGELLDRVAVPYGRTIAGFGKDVVYLGVLDEHGARLERARIR
ncbi:MAG: hypothetical protein H3C62_08670 [Gemmatimonadaceae bacterium]|nr:hypothetical protein [Gemmatimonadaceae bacterium]